MKINGFFHFFGNKPYFFVLNWILHKKCILLMYIILIKVKDYKIGNFCSFLAIFRKILKFLQFLCNPWWKYSEKDSNQLEMIPVCRITWFLNFWWLQTWDSWPVPLRHRLRPIKNSKGSGLIGLKNGPPDLL